MADQSLQPAAGQLVQENVYKPSELIAIFNTILSQQSINAKVVYLRGIYWRNPRQDPRWTSCFDILRDEDSQDELTLKITQKQRETLKDGSLVSVGGVLSRQVSNKGYIQLLLTVSRIEVVSDHVVDEAEIRRSEIRQRKALIGFKNVDGILEQCLFIGERPRIALLYASVSITDSDFEAGCKAAQSAMDFQEFRVNFASSDDLCRTLVSLDNQGFTCIAIVRGGGGGLEHLDDVKVLEVVANMNTPVIAAVGHVEEKVFLKQIVDKVSPTPNGLGAYFSDLVEKVAQKKEQSVSVLTEKIRKQFVEQIETANKQNKTLQTQLGQLTKASEESQKQHKVQIEEANKQNKTLQERLEQMNKTLQASQKSHTEQMTALQNQMKAQNEASEKARKEQQEADERKNRQFNESLTKMQEVNSKLQASLDRSNVQIKEALQHSKDLEVQLAEARNGNGGRLPLWALVVIVICIIIIVVLILK